MLINHKMKIILFIFLFMFTPLSSYAKKAPESFANLAEILSPSVVNISTTTIIEDRKQNLPAFPPGSPFEEFFKQFQDPNQGKRRAQSLGSGFIIDKKGFIITNNHVIENAEKIMVILHNDKSFEAEVVGKDPKTDVALLKIDPKNTDLKAVKFGNSNDLRVGDWVMAIGNPFGLGGTVTAGIVSARGRNIGGSYDDYIQTDASINQGNSGGPLFNLKGEVIGINTAIIAPGQSGSIGIGFAIPANAASSVIDQLIKFGETKRGWLGVRIQEVSKEIAEVEKLKKPEGALVASVGKNSPAEKAGIKAGDIILEFDGKKINTMKKLPNVVASTEVGKSVELKIWRNKKLISKRLILGRLESSEEFKERKSKVVKKEEEIESLKITVREINDKDKSSRNLDKKITGVVITNISSRSPLVNQLSINDIIIEVQKTKIKSISDLEKKVENIFKKGEKTLLLTIINKNNQRRYLGVKIN